MYHSYWRLHTPEPVLHNQRSHCNEKRRRHNERIAPAHQNQRKPRCSNGDPAQSKIKKKKYPWTSLARNKIIIKHYKDSGQINGGQENGTCTVTSQDLLSRINMLCPETNQAKTESYNHQLTFGPILLRTYKSLESNLNMVCFLVNLKEGRIINY